MKWEALCTQLFIMDIREREYITEKELKELNFIRTRTPYVFRRHYRQGLRSHIMEIIPKNEWIKERSGIVTDDGIRRYPKAKPIKMLRIFRRKFKDLNDAIEEINRVKIVEKYLGKNHMAISCEFLVHYRIEDTWDILLCGLQDYVPGEILDPWGPLGDSYFRGIFKRMGIKEHEIKSKITTLIKNIDDFVDRIKKMILLGRHVPDLAGVGNIIITSDSNIRLVDINNISKVDFSPNIPIDDRGYPVCDKSIQALSLLEENILGRDNYKKDGIYQVYLDKSRIKKVVEIERNFFLNQT